MVAVFISYPRVERAKVQLIKTELDALGLETFFDIEGIDGGDAFPDVIDKALREARCVLGCWSPRAFESRWCMIECRTGEQNKHLVPVAIEPFASNAPPADLRFLNYLDLTDFDGREPHEGWTRTLRALSRHVGRDLTAVPASPSPTSKSIPLPTPLARAPELRGDVGEITSPQGAKPRAGAVLAGLGLAAAALVFAVLAAPKLLNGREGSSAQAGSSAPATSGPVAIARVQPGQEFDDCGGAGWCPKMIVIPAGSFMMGSPASEGGRDNGEGPQHQVTLQSFAASQYDVTFDQYDACTKDKFCPKADDQAWGRGNRPVINVRWIDARNYANWLSGKTGQTYRLLTEAEWEYAARAGTTSPFYWGASADHEHANYGKDRCCDGLASGRDQWVNTSPVGSFGANSFGLYDMLGNVGQWTEDCYRSNYSGAPTDGSAVKTGDCSARVLRGGSWRSDPHELRSAYRSGYEFPLGLNYFGFRLARNP